MLRIIQNVFISITFLTALLPNVAYAAPNSLTYQGRIVKVDGTPLEYYNVSFIFQITDQSGQCVLYQEQVNGVNMANSGGVFDIAIGKGTRTYPESDIFTVLDAMNNTGILNCKGGATYTPAIDDERKLRAQFYDGIGWKLISPDNIIRSVPYSGFASSASKLGNNVASDFILKTGIPTCTSGTFLSWNGTTLSCTAMTGLTDGTVTNVSSSNSYLSVANGTTTPSLTINVGSTNGTLAAGNDTRIVNAIQNAGSTVSIQSGSDASKGAANIAGRIYFATDSAKIYRDNGASWDTIASNTTPGITSLTSDVSATGVGSVTATVNTVGGSSAANIHSAELLANAATNANTADTIVKRDSSGNFSAGTVTGNFVGNMTGFVTGSSSLNVLKAGDSMTGNLIFSSTKGTVFTDSSANTVSILAPTNITSSYSLKLPAAVAGSSGQVLTSDTSGNLSWSTPSTTATAYSGVLPVANGGTNNSTALNNNRIMVSNAGAITEAAGLANGQLLIGSTGAAPVAASLTAGSGITITPGAGSISIATSGLGSTSLADGKIWVGQTTTPTAITPSGDLSMTNAGSFTVSKIQGTSINATAPTTAGQVLRYNGTSWTPNFVSMADLRSTITGSSAIASCTSGQTLTWSAATDNLACSDIVVGASNFSSQTANTVLAAPNGSAGTPTFRTLAEQDIPTLSTAGKVSGSAINSGTIGGTASISTSGNISTSGRIIASASSTTTAKLEVSGQVLSKVFNAGSSTSIDWNNGNLQFTSANCGAMTFSNMFEGGAYTLIVTGATSGTCSFSQTSPDTVTPGSFKFVPAVGPTIASKTTVFTLLRAGNIVYVSWITGY